MKYSIEASITPMAAAKLLLSGDMELTRKWPTTTARAVLEDLLMLSIDEVLQIIDVHKYGAVADIKYVPQFGKIDSLIAVPYYFTDSGQSSADYAQLGFYLKKDASAKLDANIKFGENHGKGAALLGIVNCIDKRIVPSSISTAFCSLSHDQQVEVIMRLLFRIPVVQIILHEAKDEQISGYAPLSQFKESTMHRRGQCLRAIFKTMGKYGHPNLNLRISNINWDSTGGATDAQI